nr:hypothetical protein [uncultured Massilia sp.]
MRTALVLERDGSASAATKQLFQWVGYNVIAAHSIQDVLLKISVITFDVIVMHSIAIPGDRRCLPSELKRRAPLTNLVLLTSNEKELIQARDDLCGCIAFAFRRPVSLVALQRAMDYGFEGLGPQRTYVPPDVERRHSVDGGDLAG